MSFGFGVNDFIQVSQLAFKLYRKCRESPREFANLTSEGVYHGLGKSRS